MSTAAVASPSSPESPQPPATTPTVVQLSRGGCVVNTKVGAIQFGIPPETIKDCMNLGMPIHSIYVFPKRLFDRPTGVNVAEAEFPAYFNFFILKKVVKFVCTRNQEIKIRQVFQETLLGPKEIDVRHEYVDDVPQDCIPDLPKECAFIRTFHTIDELFTFIHFDDEGIATLGDGVIKIVDAGDEFVVREDGAELARAPALVNLPHSLWQGPVLSGSASQPPFDPPIFGVTILGSGHGFDPSHRTSGFVIWINKRGIMIDPPLYSRDLLHRNGVPSRLIDSVIITHCHADHDQGTLQKILEEKQVSIITTPTILGSFLRKYSALTSLSEDHLRRLFVFRPVLMGEPMQLHGGEIHFFYSIHTIPCIGCEVYYGGKSIYVSGDTCYDPELIERMHKSGALPKGRADWWLGLKFHHNIILHEAGVPPIHTPVSVLAKLDEQVKKRMYLVHTSKKSVPQDSGLKIAPEGVANTIYLDVERHVHGEAIELLKVMEGVDFFSNFTLAQAREILTTALTRNYKAGETIIEPDTPGEEFFIIRAGIVTVSDPAKQWPEKHLVVGDYFGEMSLVTGSKRSALIVSKTDVRVVCFKKEDFLAILRGNKDTIQFIENLSARRREPSWQIICSNSVLGRMSNAQKTRFQAILQRITFKKDDTLFHVARPAEIALLIGEGKIQLKDDVHDLGTASPSPTFRTPLQYPSSPGSPQKRLWKKPAYSRSPSMDTKSDLDPFGYGAFIGDIDALLSATQHTFSAIAVSDGWAYTIERNDLLAFFEQNPGVKMCFLDTTFVEAWQEADKEKAAHEADGCPF